MRSLLRELRHSAHRLRRAPAFSVAAVVTLALGIGANTAIFSVVEGVVLRPLPYPESDRLLWLDHAAPGIGSEQGLGMAPGLYLHYRGLSRTLQGVGIYNSFEATLTGEGAPERVEVASATPSLFDVLGVPPLLGRPLSEDDDFSSGTGVALLSHGLWVRRFGADPRILSRTILVNGFPLEVVGVMPPGFGVPSEDTGIWIPLRVPPTARFGGFVLSGIGRLKPGLAPADAEAELDGLIPRLAESFDVGLVRRMVDEAKLTARVIPLKEQIVGNIASTLWIVLGTVGLVLLIACANVANLFLVRAESKQRELALRNALGARRRDLLLHYLSESMVLALAGGGLGVLLAAFGVDALIAIGPAELPRLSEIAINANVLIFSAAITVLAGVLFGLIPIVRIRSDIARALREGGRGATAGRVRLRTRSVLVVGQIALALVLLVGSGLMIRSFWHLKNVDPGFDAANVLTFELGLSGSDYPNQRDAIAFHRELLDRLEGLPGVQAAAATSCLPLSGWCGGNPLSVEGATREPGEIPPVVALRRASAGYFEAMRIPLMSGRPIERADQENRTNAAVVSRALAALYWPGQDPIGKRVYPSDAAGDSTAWYTVVGVVGDVPVERVTDSPKPLIYFALLDQEPGGRWVNPYTLRYVIRASAAPLDLAGAVRNEIRRLDPNVPIARVQTMEKVVSDASIQTAFTMVLLVIAGGVALLFGAVGIYGVVAYVVAQRTAEIGVRMALGASASDVRRLVLKQGGAMAVVGLSIGLLGSFALTRVLRALLFGVSPIDPVTFASVATLLFAVTLLASYVPARRAARVDPTESLRVE